jgi:hypothetical protein
MTNHSLHPQTQTRTLLSPNRANRSDRIEFLEARRCASLDFSFATIPLAGWQSALCTGLGAGWVSARPKSQARGRRRAVVLILTSFLSLTRQHLSSAHTGIASSVSTYTFGLLLGKLTIDPFFTSYPYTSSFVRRQTTHRFLFRLRFRCLQVFTFYRNNVFLSILSSSRQAGASSSLRRQAIHRFGCPTAGCFERCRSAPGRPKRSRCKSLRLNVNQKRN